MTAVGPAFEFNWGAMPNIQLHAILPLGGAWPSNNPAYLPGGTGESAFGVTDVELGFKWGFIKQTKHRPQIGSFTMFEIPTGSYAKGLGVGEGLVQAAAMGREGVWAVELVRRDGL